MYIYLLWILLHFISTHLYVYLCIPKTFYGLLYSPFMIQMPYCIGLFWIMKRGNEIINIMWITTGKIIVDNINTQIIQNIIKSE